jgi:hypothetical protein
VHVAWTSASGEYESFVFCWPDDAIRDWLFGVKLPGKYLLTESTEYGAACAQFS